MRLSSIQFGAIFMAFAIGASSASAHTLVGTIPASKTAVVKWQITCYAPASQMIFRLKQAKTSRFSVDLTVSAANQSTEVTARPVKNLWTPYASLEGGATDYVLTLRKVGTNPNSSIAYTVDDHCESPTGEHTAQSNAKRLPR